MNKKYEFILRFQDCHKNEIEIHSKEEIEDQNPSLIETHRMKGVFDSYDEAKKAAEELEVLKVVVTHDHNNGEWIETEDSIDDFDETPFYFFSYIAAEAWAYSKLMNDEYEDDDEEGPAVRSMFEIMKIDNIDIEVVEITS